MDMLLGIPNLRVDEVDECHDRVEIFVTPTQRAACRNCGWHNRMESKGRAVLKVRDTPSRGKPTMLVIYRRRYECLICKSTSVDPTPLVDTRSKLTDRLLRYIHKQVTKHPIASVGRETGVPDGTVRDIALDLAAALDKHHRFPTPRVLGMDGLKLNRRDHEYMVIGDADRGHLIGIVERARTSEVRQWMIDHDLAPLAVEIFVSDMHSVNNALAKDQFQRALHVADKWHVIKNYQAALSQIVDKAVHDLREGIDGVTKNPALASAIDDRKSAIMSVSHSRLRMRRRHAKGEQIELDFGRDLAPYIDRVDAINRGYWARYDLIDMYKCSTEADALICRKRFMERIKPLAHLDKVGKYIKHLDNHSQPIANYFLARSIRTDGTVRGPTTNALEQRNSMIRKIWRSGHGMPTLPLIRLRAIYGQWELGSEIVECTEPDCSRIMGPLLGPPCPPSLAGVTTAGPRCFTHAV